MLPRVIVGQPVLGGVAARNLIFFQCVLGILDKNIFKLMGWSTLVFINEEEIKQKILSLSPEKARKLGIKHRSTLKRMKDRTVEEGKINLGIKK